MSDIIDRRIVEMKFDNKDFENNIQDSIESLDELKKSLDLEESAKAFSALEKASEAVTHKFSKLGTIGDQVLRRISDACLNALRHMKNFVDALTIDPVKTGLQEYETQINSIQTMLSNSYDYLTKTKGLTTEGDRVAYINERLDELNHYADKTIYNFTQMTESIGRFTAAGVDLDTSVAAIQGIANLAAVSGSTADQASNAMYMLSQAMQAGTVTAYQWNSVMRAGMGGEVFQKAILRNAKKLKKTVEVTVDEIDQYGRKVKKTVNRTIQDLVDEVGFKESLSKGWLDSDLLKMTLDQFSWDFEERAKELGYTVENIQEGIAAAMKEKETDLISQGYTGEEAEEMVRLARDAMDAATKVKTFTQLFDTLKEAAQSGWTETWRYIIGDFEEAKTTLTGISDFIGDIISASAEARNKIVKDWHDAGGRDMLFNKDPEKGPLGAFWNLAYGIKNITDMIKRGIQKIIPPMTSQKLLDITQKIQQATASFKSFTESLGGSSKIKNLMQGVSEDLTALFKPLKDGIAYIGDGFKQLFGQSRLNSDSFLEFAESISDWIMKVRESIKLSDTFQSFLQKCGSAAVSFKSFVVGGFKAAVPWIQKLVNQTKKSDIFSKIGDGISTFVGKVPGAAKKFREFVRSIVEYVKTSGVLSNTWRNINTFFEPVLLRLSDFGKRLRNAISSLFSNDGSDKNGLWERFRSVFSTFGKSFSNGFGSIKTSVINAWINAKNFLSNFFTKTIPEFFGSDALSNALASIGEGVRTFLEGFANFFLDMISVTAYASDKLDGTASDVSGIDNAESIWDKIVEFFSKIKSGLSSFWESLKNADWDAIEDIAGHVAAVIKAVLSVFTAKYISKSFKSVGTGIMGIGTGFSGIGESIAAFGSGVASLKDGFKGLSDGLVTLGENLSKIEKNKHKDSIGTTMLKLAGSIALLSGAVYILSTIDFKKGLKAIGLVSILAVEFLGLSYIFSKLKINTTSFLKLGVAVALLVIPIKALAKMEVADALRGVFMLGIVLAELAGFMRLAGTGFAEKQNFLALSIGVAILSIVIKRLAKMNIEDALQGVFMLGIIFAELVGFMKLSGTGFAEKQNFLALSIGVAILTIVVKRLAKMNIKDALQGVFMLGAILAEIGLFTRLVGKDTAKVSGLIGLAIAVDLMIIAIKSLAKLDFGGLVKSLLGMEILLLEIASFSKRVSDKKIAGMIAMAIGINLMVTAVRRMGKLDTKTIIKGVLGLGGIMLAFGGMMKFAGGAKFGTSAALLVAMAGSLILFIEAFKYVQDMNMDDMLKFAASISSVMLSLSIALKLISTIPVVGALKGIASFAILIAGIGGVLIGLGALQSKWSGMTSFLESGGDVLGKIGTALGKFVGGIGNGIVTGLDLPKMGTDLSDFMTNVSGFIEGAKGIDAGATSGVLELTKAIIAIAGSEFRTALVQLFIGEDPITKFTKDIVALGHSLSAYAISVLPMAFVPTTVVDRSISVASALADVAQKLQPSNFWSLLSGVKSFSTFGDDIKKLGSGLTSFATEVSSIEGFDKTKIDAVVDIANGLAQLETGLEAQGGLEDVVAGIQSLAVFGFEIKPFGKNLNDFITEANQVTYDPDKDEKKITDLLSFADTLSQIESNLEGQGGIADAITGIQSLMLFGFEIRSFGKNLNDFITEANKVTFDPDKDSKKINAVLAIVKTLSGYESNLEGQGGLEDAIEGTKSLSKFSEGFEPFGEGLNKFITEVNGIEANPEDESFQNKLSAIVSIATTLSEFEKTLEAQGGWEDFWLGSKDLGTFGTNIKELGEAIASYMENIQGVDNEIITKTTTAMETIETFAKGYNADGTLDDSFTTMMDVSDKMKEFGDEFAVFASAVNNIGDTQANFETAKTVVGSFHDFIDAFELEGKNKYKFTNTNGLLTIIEGFGTSLATFTMNITETSDDLNAAANVINSIIFAIGTVSSIPDFSIEPIQQFLNSFAALTIPQFDEEGMASAQAFVINLVEGIGGAEAFAAVVTSIGSLSDAGSTAAEGTYGVWYASGQYLAAGLGAGISSMAGSVAASAVSVAAGAIHSIQMTWSVHSPSRVGEELGMYFDLGIASGLETYSRVVSGQAADMGQSVVDSASTMLRGVDGSIFDNIDPNPTIRPVMDLTNIQNGVGVINDMFNSERMIGQGLFRGMNFSRGVDALNLDGARILGSINNKDVVSELQSLSSRFDNLADAVSNMKLILDSGELVGRTSAMMDSSLGTLDMRRRRGN